MESKRQYIAIIADMVKSRTLPARERSTVQHQFSALVTSLNRKYSSALASRFVITLGDECQGLLKEAAILPDLLWDIQFDFNARELRVGIGFGVLHTPVQKYAINIDGPVMHNARAAIEEAKSGNRLGGVFFGFGASQDIIHNGFARILQFYREKLAPQQKNVIEQLKQEKTQMETASELGLTKQAISLYARNAGWEAYKEAVQGWRVLLSGIDNHAPLRTGR